MKRRIGPRVYAAPGKLPAPEQRTFDDLVAARGIGPTAKHLGISTALVEKLIYGGAARQDAVERVLERMRRVA